MLMVNNRWFIGTSVYEFDVDNGLMHTGITMKEQYRLVRVKNHTKLFSLCWKVIKT